MYFQIKKKRFQKIKYEIRLTKEILDQNLNDVLHKFVFNFVKSTLQKEIKKFDLKSSWAVCQFESDYNPIHWHDGHLSGVMYTKMPKDLGSSYKDQIRMEKLLLFMDQHSFQFPPCMMLNLKLEIYLYFLVI